MSTKVALVSSDGLKIDLHFGQAKEFFIYELQKDAFVQIERRELAVNSREATLRQDQGPQREDQGPQDEAFCCPGGGESCGGCGGGSAGPLAPAVELLLDCQAVIAAQIGQNMRRQFERNAISVFDIELQVSEALEKLAAYYSKLGV